MRGDEYINPKLPSFPDVNGLKVGTAPWQARWLAQRCSKCFGDGDNHNPAYLGDECQYCEGSGLKSSGRPPARSAEGARG